MYYVVGGGNLTSLYTKLPKIEDKMPHHSVISSNGYHNYYLGEKMPYYAVDDKRSAMIKDLSKTHHLFSFAYQ
jgi:hypothetical protein